MFCYSCGFQLPAGARFCVGCGAQVVHPGTQSPVVPAPAQSHAVQAAPGGVALCPRCGGRNPNDNLFCNNCGASLQPSLSVARQPADVSEVGLDATSAKPEQTATAAQQVQMPQQVVGQSQKVGGWLLLFCFGLIVGNPLSIVKEILESPDIPLLIAAGLALAGFSIYTGIAVARVRPNALRLVKIIFIVMLVLAFLSLLGSFSSGDVGESGQGSRLQGVIGAGRIVLAVGIWWSYFRKSTRVRATFGSNL